MPYNALDLGPEWEQLSQDADYFRQLKEMAPLAGPNHPQYYYSPSEGGIQGGMLGEGGHDNVVDELEFLKGLIAKRQGKLYDDFKMMTNHLLPPDEFRMDVDSQVRMAPKFEAYDTLGYTYNPATDAMGPAKGWDDALQGPTQAPPSNRYALEVGQPQIDDEEAMLRQLAERLREGL